NGTLFRDTLAVANENEVVPAGYGLLPEEWENGAYPTYEMLNSGRRSGKDLRIVLPDSVWRPRAELWGRALAILDHI
ncbi:hypothetical protein C8J57DRAFT_997915, partial [Mycena rebaudengoi]